MAKEPLTSFKTVGGVTVESRATMIEDRPVVFLSLQSGSGRRINYPLEAADLGNLCRLVEDARTSALDLLVRKP